MMFQPLNEMPPIIQPHSVDEVVDILFFDLSLRDKVILASLTENDLEASIYLVLAKTIREEFGLYNGNQELLASCCSYLGHGYDTYEDPAMVITKELWKKIKNSHRLRLIK